MLLKLWRGYGMISGPNACRRLPTSVPTIRLDHYRNNSNDNVLMAISSSANTSDLFHVISLQRNQFNGDHAMQSLKTLFALQKGGNTTMHPAQIIKSPDFEQICRALKRHSRALPLNDVVDALKILLYLGISPNSTICLTFLHLIRHQINDISLGQIVFLEFLLNKCESTPLVEALRMALPMLLQIQLGTKMDHENTGQLTDLLLFVSRYRVADPCVMNIVSGLTMHGDRLTIDEACNIIRALSQLRTSRQINYDKLLENCVDVLCNRTDLSQLKFEQLENTLSHMTDKCVQKCDQFYVERFWNLCAEVVVARDEPFLNSIYVQRKFAKINFVSLKLLQHICEKLAQDSKMQAELWPMPLITLVNGLSSANYKPNDDVWSVVVSAIQQNSVQLMAKNELPWIRYTNELLSLDIVNVDVLIKIFSNEFLDTYLAREYTTLDFLQLLSVWQCLALNVWPEHNALHELLNPLYVERAMDISWRPYECPLKECVRIAFGGERYVYNGVKTKWGHHIDHLIVFDECGQPVAWQYEAEKDGAFFENISVPATNKVVGITAAPKSHFGLNVPRLKGLFQLKQRSLAKLGIPLVVINLQQWTELLDHEKIPYLEREIRYML